MITARARGQILLGPLSPPEITPIVLQELGEMGKREIINLLMFIALFVGFIYTSYRYRDNHYIPVGLGFYTRPNTSVHTTAWTVFTMRTHACATRRAPRRIARTVNFVLFLARSSPIKRLGDTKETQKRKPGI